MKRVAGKPARTTGPARGIGKAFAKACVNKGATVAIAEINPAVTRAMAGEPGSRSLAIDMDATDQASKYAAIRMMDQQGGGIDIPIDNAAQFDLAPIVAMSGESAETLFTMQAAANR